MRIPSDMPRPVVVRRILNGQWAVARWDRPVGHQVHYDSWHDAIDHASFEAGRIRRQFRWIDDAEAWRAR